MGKYSAAFKNIGNSVDYLTQIAMRRFVMSALDRMDRFSISRAKLADLMETSPAYVSRALKGDVNFTLETMTKFALATGGRLDVRIVDSYAVAQESTIDVDVMRGTPHLVPLAPKAASDPQSVSRIFSMDHVPANEESYEQILPHGHGANAQEYRVACG